MEEGAPHQDKHLIDCSIISFMQWKKGLISTDKRDAKAVKGLNASQSTLFAWQAKALGKQA